MKNHNNKVTEIWPPNKIHMMKALEVIIRNNVIGCKHQTRNKIRKESG